LTTGGRVSTIIRRSEVERLPWQELQQICFKAAMYMLILRTILYAPVQGPPVGIDIQQTRNDFLQIQPRFCIRHDGLSEEAGFLQMGNGS
jgi:hypothetical protein